MTESYKTVLGNLYCLYSISSHGFPNPLDFKIDEKNVRFGTHCVMIKDNANFLNAINTELKKRKRKYDYSFVEYYDRNTVSKKLTLFNKPKEFEYQKEFRFYVYNKRVKFIKLTIGSLKGKAEII